MAIPLRRCRAVAIPLLPESLQPGSTSTTATPSPATETTAAIAPTLSPETTPSSSSFSFSSYVPSQEGLQLPEPAEEATEPPAELEVPLPPRRHYACGTKMCAMCARNWPPIGHKTRIPNYAVATIVRHAMPHRFHTLEQIEEREIAMGLTNPTKNRKLAAEDDGDVEYGPSGEFNPPAWTSDKARPKKSCLRKRESNRFAPYPSPSTRSPLVRRSTKDIKASLDEALANRMLLNYEGPYATTIRNEISAIHIPGVVPFKWQPEYTGPPSETFDESDQPLSETTNVTEPQTDDWDSSPQKDLKGKAAVGQLTLPRPSKKRQHEEDKEDDEIHVNSFPKPIEGSPPKKQRVAKQLPTPAFSNAAKRKATSPKPRLSSSSPSPPSSPSPSRTRSTSPSLTRSTSPSETLNRVSTDSSTSSSDEGRLSSAPSEGDSQDSSARKARIAKKKLRFQFSNPSSTHPKFGTTDSLYFHHRRAKSLSHKVRETKGFNTFVPVTGDWTEADIEYAEMKKVEWDQSRKATLQRLTSRKGLENRVRNNEKNDALVEQFQKLVDRYEAGWSGIDLAGVRARYIRPAKKEVPKTKNKEAMPFLIPQDTMRKYYPSWDHPAWEGVDENAIANWKKSLHFKLKVWDVMVIVKDEEGQERRAKAAPEDATEIATVVDEEEARMRREFLESQVSDLEASSAAEPASS